MKKITITHIPLVLSCSMISFIAIFSVINHFQNNTLSVLSFGLVYPIVILLALIVFLAPYTTFYLEKNKFTASKFLGLRRKTYDLDHNSVHFGHKVVRRYKRRRTTYYPIEIETKSLPHKKTTYLFCGKMSSEKFSQFWSSYSELQ